MESIKVDALEYRRIMDENKRLKEAVQELEDIIATLQKEDA